MTVRRRARRVLPVAAVSLVITLAAFACGTDRNNPGGQAAGGTVAVPVARTSPVVAPSPKPASTGRVAAAGATDRMFGRDARPLARVPKDDPRRGLIYKGLVAAKTGPCVGGYQLTGTKQARCTHGPDAPPQNVSVKVPATPVAAAAAAASPGLPVCEGDGTTGRRVEVLYVHGTTSRYAEYLETFRVRAEQVDDIYYQSAQETGGARRVRYVTETVGGLCRPVVRDVGIADSALGDFDTARDAVRTAGYTRNDRKYLMFVDTNVYCGIGEFLGDTRKTDANRSNGGGYSRVDNGCWQYPDVAAHELGHNLGAVNDDAPNASHHAHCVDEYDVMCYKDADDTVMRTACADQAHDMRLDCNHDDYYNTDPSPGSYLATEYNVADNLFLIKGTPPAPAPSVSVSPRPSVTPSPTPSSSTPPAVQVIKGKQSGRCVDMDQDIVTNGSRAQLWDCNGGRNQAWTYTSGKALLLHDNKCLDAYGQGTAAGTLVVSWDCNGEPNQQWAFNADGTVTGVQSGLCLDAAGQGTANGTKLLLWTCQGQANQQWSRS